MRISFKRNGFIALASMLSFAVYAGDNLPLATAASGTNGSIQVSEHGVDTSNEIQQARVIQGTVLEEGTNEPLIGVNVVVKGTTIGTTTDVEGKYSIRIPSDNAVLVFSYIGQKTEEYSVKGLKSLDVIMKSDATMLSEVVVYTGYMTQKKADLTGSVALADSKDIKKTSANVMKAMQGKMAGVKISNNGGNPAEDIGIQIRGLSSLSGAVTPLIVLDGMPAEGLNLRDINSGDIESIQVLKDAASASIYGARASGGVILVQTKKGKAGKTTIDYNGSVSVSSIINRPEMMNATEWGTAAFRAAAYDEWAYGSGLLLPNGFEYEYHRGDNGMLVLDNMKMKEYLDNNQLVKATDTNWMDEIFRTAVSTNHQLTISNGSDKAKSLFSLGYTNNQGTQIHSFFKQYSVRANTEYSLIKDRLKVGENLAISYLQYKSQWETFLAMIMPPMVPVYDVNGNWAGPAGLDDFDNPVRKMTMGKDNINNYVKIIGNVFADLNIWNGISARTQFGINYGNSYSRTVDGAYVETGFRGNDKNYVRNNQSHPLNYVWTNTLSYNKSFGKHHIDAVFGSEFTRYVQEGFYASREGLYLEDRDFAGLSVATGDEIDVSSSADEYTYFSLFAKANYSYAGKYLLSATVRRDGSSLFGVNNRYGVFPAFSAGWRIKDEAFMEDADWLSDLKIRFSWGTNGSVQGLPRGYTTTPFTTNYFDTAYPIKGQATGALQSGYRRTWIGNPDLKWEETSQTDLGLDFGFLGNALTFTVDWYKKKTDGMLMQMPLPAYVGDTPPMGNVGKMENSGIEMDLSYRFQVSDLNVKFGANASYLKNKLIELGNAEGWANYDAIQNIGTITRAENGEPFPFFYGKKTAGIFQNWDEVNSYVNSKGEKIQPNAQPGDVRFVDANGDGKIDDADRVKIGKGMPDWTVGFSIALDWRGFDLNAFFQGTIGNDVFDGSRRIDLKSINLPSYMLDRWHGEGTSNKYPRLSENDENGNWLSSDLYIKDGSYLRLKNIQLGYTLPKAVTTKFFVQNLRVYVGAENLFTITGYDGFDPEISSGGTSLGVDKGVYPQAKTFTVGANITF